MATKDVKITFHTLIQRMWKQADESENKEQPFFFVGEVLDYIGSIKSKDKTQKFYELKDKKFCFIDMVNKISINDKDFVYFGIFKSARSEFRPNLINRKTGSERKNPKEISEVVCTYAASGDY